MYTFKKITIPDPLNINDIMAQAGSEARFGGRFVKYAGTSDTFTKSIDATGNGINDLRSYAGMISEQKKGIDKLFLAAERAINSVNALEKESGQHQVDNIPLPSDIIRESYGKKMGYSTLVCNFMAAGLVHFMEETINLKEALDTRDKIISTLAGQIPQLEVIGQYEDVGLDELLNHTPTDVASYTKATSSPVTNGATPAKKTKR